MTCDEYESVRNRFYAWAQAGANGRPDITVSEMMAVGKHREVCPECVAKDQQDAQERDRIKAARGISPATVQQLDQASDWIMRQLVGAEGLHKDPEL